MCVLWSDQDNNKFLVTDECLKKKAKEVLFSESHRCFFCSIVVVESWFLHLLHKTVITVWLQHLAFLTLKHGSRKPEDDDKHIQECNLTLLFIILTLLVILILQKSWETLHFLFYTSLQRSISSSKAWCGASETQLGFSLLSFVAFTMAQHRMDTLCGKRRVVALCVCARARAWSK